MGHPDCAGPGPRPGVLALRTDAFVGVVLAAEGVFGLVIVLTEGSDVARLAADQRAETTSAIVSAL
ncbi:MAG: hypothetical protein ACP5VR_09455 [Acidimicrobiales bacterium]